MFVKKVT